MKKCAAVVLIVVLLCTMLTLPANAAGFALPESVSVTAASAYFVNLDTGIVVYEKNADQRRSVASLTKLMTALLLVENVQDLDGTVWLAESSLFVPPITNSDSSTSDIRPREEVTARSVLYGMLLPSGNEAAAIAAYHLGNGNLENFYAMMNARAKELGCNDTNFTNPHGLIGMDGGNYSTAHDLYLIANACWQNETFRTAATTPTYTMPATNKHAEPYLIQTSVKTQVVGTPVYRDYFRGMKTGSTMEAGRNYVSSAVSPTGESFIGVVLGSPWEAAEDGYAQSFHDSINLYDWIFANFSVKPTLDVTSPIAEVPVTLSNDTDALKLFPAADLKTILPNSNAENQLEKEFNLPESVKAPIKQGDKIGTVTIRVADETIGTVDLVAAQDVSRNTLLLIFDRIGAFFKSTYVRVVLILTAIYIAGYVAIYAWIHYQAQKRREARRRREEALRKRNRGDD